MYKTKRISAAVMSGSLLLWTLPNVSVFAADETVEPVEEIVMTAVITLNGDSAVAEGENVTVEDTTVTITASGAYEFSGTLYDGQIAVNVPDEIADPGTVKLFFNGVDITGVSEAPIYVINAENTSLNLMDGTENFLSDGGKYTETTAVIFAKDDITIKSGGTLGDGKLNVESQYQDAVHCNNDVKISGGNIKIRTNNGDGVTTGIGDGIRGKTSVEIKGGKVDINSGGDGVKSTKGDVFITGGTIDIKAGNDAVQGETSVQISGGILKANGDRSLTNANVTVGNAVTITGGEILATATDNQATIVDNLQNVLLFNTVQEQVKDQEIALTVSGTEETVFSMTPDKKFDYVLISSANLTEDRQYELTVGGFSTEAGIITLDRSGITSLTDVICNNVLARGDIDGDGIIGINDAMSALNAYIEESVMMMATSLNAVQYTAADVNLNGKVELVDAKFILIYYSEDMIGNAPDWDTLISA